MPEEIADWVMVPREPTEAMIGAGAPCVAAMFQEIAASKTASGAHAINAYRAMLSAAPPPPNSSGAEITILRANAEGGPATEENPPPSVEVGDDGITRVFTEPSEVVFHDDGSDPNAEVRDSETGEVIFPARKVRFHVVADEDPKPQTADPVANLIRARDAWIADALAKQPTFDMAPEARVGVRLGDLQALGVATPSPAMEALATTAKAFQVAEDERAGTKVGSSSRDNANIARDFAWEDLQEAALAYGRTRAEELTK